MINFPYSNYQQRELARKSSSACVVICRKLLDVTISLRTLITSTGTDLIEWKPDRMLFCEYSLYVDHHSVRRDTQYQQSWFVGLFAA